MLRVYFGKDSFSLREALAGLRSSLDTDGMLSSNTVLLDGRKTTLSEVRATCDTVPFLGTHRLVLVEGLLNRLGGSRRGRSTNSKASTDEETWLAIADYVDHMPETTDLVLIDGEVASGNRFLGVLRGKGEIREFRPLNDRAVADWIRSRAKDLGLNVTPGSVRLLTEFVGNDLWTLAAELDKLSAYSVDGQVNDDDVRSLVTAVREASIFPLVDAIVEGRPAAAMKLLRQMFRNETTFPYILAMLQRQLRHLAIARDMLDDGASGGRISEVVGLKGYPLEKLLEQSAMYSSDRVRAAFERLLDSDVQIKRGIYGDELALELLVHDLAATRQVAAT